MWRQTLWALFQTSIQCSDPFRLIIFDILPSSVLNQGDEGNVTFVLERKQPKRFLTWFLQSCIHRHGPETAINKYEKARGWRRGGIAKTHLYSRFYPQIRTDFVSKAWVLRWNKEEWSFYWEGTLTLMSFLT